MPSSVTICCSEEMTEDGKQLQFCYYFNVCVIHQHLTTFVLDRKEAMITVDDGIRKLKLLDAKGKVWTQDMILQVDDKAVSLVDLESKNELENFPLSTIQHCQAVMNACNYNSILALVCKEPTQNKPDLHLFQCD
uniref:PTB domain-containing protein n=1 Tax=Pavo cristatus TaxID=9049 RepID=A0A8C9FXM9_PAVCR